MGRVLTHTSAKRTTQPARGKSQPLLWEGQRLDRETFHRLYSDSPNLKLVQLIEGIVHMPSPMRFIHHGHPEVMMSTWLTYYSTFTTGVNSGGQSTLKIDDRNEYQPDGMLFYDKGQLVIDDDGYLVGVPELVVEVSASTQSVDSKEKFQVYQKQGVKEYLLWNTQANDITWYGRGRSKFVPMKAGRDGVIKSKVFPGLWLNRTAMLQGDMALVLKTLQEGLESKVHQKLDKKFV